MARKRSEVDELAARIEALKAADRVNLYARLPGAIKRELDWSALVRPIRRKLKIRDPRKLDQIADEGVREIRRASGRSG